MTLAVVDNVEEHIGREMHFRVLECQDVGPLRRHMARVSLHAQIEVPLLFNSWLRVLWI